MKNRWNDQEYQKTYASTELDLRVYTSRLLGAESDLVLHGGGNTSMKGVEKNIFGEEEKVLYVKGSGWDLKIIEGQGFTPCNLDAVLRLSTLETMTDTEMVRELKKSILKPGAPNPSVETILHALIPFKFVDHTHADAMVAVSNTEGGEDKIREIYGPKTLVLPYIMPGFILAKQVFEATKDIDWKSLDSIVLLNHGIFTFSDDGKESYDKMIVEVSKAEDYLTKAGAAEKIESGKIGSADPLKLANIRAVVSKELGKPIIGYYKNDELSVGYSNLKNLEACATRGPITPDHVISTKRIPVILGENTSSSIDQYSKSYTKYFETNKEDGLTCLDTLPRLAIMPGEGAFVMAPNFKRAIVISDISDHTFKAVQWGEALGGWKALPEKDIFDLEYWELEQAKLKVGAKSGPFDARIVLVTGAASGIGRAMVKEFAAAGACVVAADIDSKVLELFSASNILPLVFDATDTASWKETLKQTIYKFGGLDILVSNAGTFPPSLKIEDLDDSTWEKTINVNLTSHLKALRESIPFLKEGWNPQIILTGSKNVAAPGPGAAAYSSSKAGLVQLARVAALELAPEGIRVNTIHPDAVFDTGIWSEDILTKRADHYGMSIEEYKKKNLLGAEITSKDVAALAVTMASPAFLKTTGAHIPIDGGNDRVI